MKNSNFMKSLAVLNEELSKIATSCPEIVYVGEPILRQVAEEVDLAEALGIAEKLKKTLLTYRQLTGFGRGLALTGVPKNRVHFEEFSF